MATITPAAEDVDLQGAAENTSPEPAAEGLFDADARQQAIADALPVLAGYFAKAETWEVHPQPALLSADGALDRDLAQRVRLRVLLALGRRLEAILHPIVDNPSFRYGIRADESVGVIAGRLDVPRFVRS